MTTVRSGALALALGTMAMATFRSVSAAPVQAKKKVVPAPSAYGRDVKAVIVAQCVGCHGKNSPSAGLNLVPLTTEVGAKNDLGTLEKAMGRVMSGEMPPGSPLPMAKRKAFQAWTQEALAAQCAVADPGRVTLRRLNREEYNNTVRDLLGTTRRPADDFPGDDVGNGFDNMGDVLTMSPLLMEKVLDSADRLARETIAVPKVFTRHYDGSDFAGAGGSDGSTLSLNSGGLAQKEVRVSVPGSYRLGLQAWGQQAGGEAPKMRVSLDGQPVGTFDVPNTKGKRFELPITLGEGPHKIGVEFTNDYYDEKSKADRNLYVDFAEVTGPIGAITYPESHKRIVPYEPAKGQEEATARKFLEAFVSRAFRRPATPQDLDRLMPVYQAGAKGGSFDEGMRLAVQAVLSSPRFMFRLEQDPPGTSGKVRALDGFEVASRLSYFLWSTMPDQTLLDLAAKGKMTQPAVIKAQVARMIQDPKAQALAENFAAQWLNLRMLSIVEFDPRRYKVSRELRNDMATETKSFFMGVLRNGRPISDFIDGNYTYLNGRLAEHYGIPGVTGDEFRRVALTGERGGVLTQASVLTITSNPTRTSPTKRGKWVLENIFNAPPPPPPPGVSDIPDEKHKVEATTLRKLMEEHRKNPACAVCHQKMDPIGFGMENFDPIGRWRDKEGQFDVDASGTLPTGQSFRGAGELKKILLARKPEIAKAISEKLLTYALGRAVDYKDRCALEATVAKAAASGYRLDALVVAVATSDPFLKRKAQ